MNELSKLIAKLRDKLLIDRAELDLGITHTLKRMFEEA